VIWGFRCHALCPLPYAIVDFHMDPDQKVVHSLIEKFVRGSQRGEPHTLPLAESLGLKDKEVVSLVGAGGKTTLMFRLARELLLEGKKVVTTTTTKILEPTSEETAFLFIDADEEKTEQFVRGHLDQYRHITLSTERLGSGKLCGVSPNLVKNLWSSSGIDVLIIEADGAARRPVKAPREGEPVIPSNTTLVVAILGVDGVGMELNEEKVFQAERISKMTGIPMGRKLTGEGMAVLMTHDEGIFKGAPPSSRVIAFLNKVDLPEGMIKAREVALKIRERKHHQIERVVLGQLEKDPPVVDVIFLGK
jgi:probable selenium-dependent hydroxylase accessory protein YqeC